VRLNPANQPGFNGTYTIDPRPYIQRYLEVMADQRRQMAEENILAAGMRGLSAELLIDFTYTIRVPEWGFRQTVTQGYRLSLSTEVYGLAVTGVPNFSETIVQAEALPFPLTFPVVIGFVLLVALSGYGVFDGIRFIRADPDEKRREVKTLLRKYGNEIILSPDSVDVFLYQIVRIDDFDELLKLAITLSKHIRCWQNDKMARFSLTVDGELYPYQVYFETPGVDGSIQNGEAEREEVAIGVDD
jgi:hypothetical protein